MDEVKASLTAFINELLSWKWFVRFVRWLIISGGTVAESAFLVATLYVTICVVAHPLLVWILPENVILVLNQVSVIVFACIPELIVFSAVKVTIDHWRTAFATRNKWSFVWAVSYTIPTVVFLAMTIITITSFVSLQEINVSTYQVSGANLIIRVMFGWLYGVVGMLFDSIGKSGYAETIRERDTMIATLSQEVALRDNDIATLNEKVLLLEDEIRKATGKMSQTEQELMTARIALAHKKVLRGQSATVGKVTRPQSATRTNESATDESDTSEKRQRVKDIMHQAIMRGDKINLKKLASDAEVSYGMMRKHADTIIQEITRERKIANA